MSKHRILGGGVVELRQHIHPAGHTNVSEHVEPAAQRELTVCGPSDADVVPGDIIIHRDLPHIEPELMVVDGHVETRFAGDMREGDMPKASEGDMAVEPYDPTQDCGQEDPRVETLDAEEGDSD